MQVYASVSQIYMSGLYKHMYLAAFKNNFISKTFKIRTPDRK